MRKLIGIKSKAVVIERAKREGSSNQKVRVRQPLEAKIHRLGELNLIFVLLFEVYEIADCMYEFRVECNLN